MYKLLHIDGEDYKLEFSIEASLYNDCIEKVVELMYNLDAGQGSKDIKQVLSGFSDIPNTAITCFYAGLLEHHGTESGDGRVPNILTAKELAKKALRSEDIDINNWYDLLTLCTGQMGEDGFFELIGIDAILSAEEQTKSRRGRKKVEKVSEN